MKNYLGYSKRRNSDGTVTHFFVKATACARGRGTGGEITKLKQLRALTCTLELYMLLFDKRLKTGGETMQGPAIRHEAQIAGEIG